jgi:hypothetical protein
MNLQDQSSLKQAKVTTTVLTLSNAANWHGVAGGEGVSP